MSYTYLLYTCNAHKENATASPLYSFTEDDDIKVLDYIQANLNEFFDGNKAVKEHRFSEFFQATIEAQNIGQAINSNVDIYAMVREIPTL